MNRELKPFWSTFFGFNWKFGLFLLAIVCIPRFALVLHANSTGNYGAIGLIMVVSALAPFIFLTKYGRQEIGLKKPTSFSWLVIACFIGLLASIVLYYVGESLYGSSYQNWYAYIGKSGRVLIK